MAEKDRVRLPEGASRKTENLCPRNVALLQGQSFFANHGSGAMSADKIAIIHVEFDDAKIDRVRRVVSLNYVEWRRNGGEIESSYLGANRHAQNEGEEHVIPDD